MFTTRLFFRWQKMLLKMKVLYCPKLPQRPKFPHLTVHTILYCIGQCYHDHQLCNFSNIPYQDLVQDCSNSSALAMELLQSCTKPSISRSYFLYFRYILLLKHKIHKHTICNIIHNCFLTVRRVTFFSPPFPLLPQSLTICPHSNIVHNCFLTVRRDTSFSSLSTASPILSNLPHSCAWHTVIQHTVCYA